MHAISRIDENTRDEFADTGILVRYKCGYVAFHLTLPHRDPRDAGRASQEVVEHLGHVSIGPTRSLARTISARLTDAGRNVL